MNPFSLAAQTWTKAHGLTSQAAINSQWMRILLIVVVIGCMTFIAITLGQTFILIKAGKVDAVVGALLGGIFTFFGGILAITIPAMITALRGNGVANGNPSIPPPTIISPPDGAA